MTSQIGRIYATAVTLFVFFLTWAMVAARPAPSGSPSTGPELRALALREQRLQQESVAVQRVVARRWAAYRAQLAKRRSQIATAKQAQLAAAAAPPSVRVVPLPPVTVTRTS
jgi:hypothetical protein